MAPSALIPERYTSAHRLIADLYAGAIAAVDPVGTTTAALGLGRGEIRIGDSKIPVTGRIVVVGTGKAATRMAWAVERMLGDRVRGGLVVTKDGHRQAPLPDRIEVIEAAHPLPDERSLGAGERLLDLVASVVPDDIVIAVISGGGSALAEALRPPLTLADVRVVTDLLLRAGATIGELNLVRRTMSRLKAGGLLAASRAPVHALILSDVIGNDLGMIASGATIPGPSLSEQARDATSVLRRYGLEERVPVAVAALLTRLADSNNVASRPGVTRPVFVGDNARAVSAVADGAVRHGLVAARPADWQGREGEASELGAAFVQTCRAASDDVNVLVGGGEATVTVRGDGVGGRNTEFALAAAVALAEGGQGWIVASLATDGQDALTGAAGAIADSGTIERVRAAGLDPNEALRNNDSLRCFDAAGGLLSPGPTGTNVNDLYIGVRVRDSDS